LSRDRPAEANHGIIGQMNANFNPPRPFARSKSDEKFAEDNQLDFNKPTDVREFLIYRFDKLVAPELLPHLDEVKLKLRRNCLEGSLERRITTYLPDNVDNIKVFLAVSGAGKTRTLLEILAVQFGYYFTIQSHVSDFGSKDLSACMSYADENPKTAPWAIRLLYLVRATVCQHLLDLGYTQPHQILCAQIHPLAFFGVDIFHLLLSDLLREYPESFSTGFAFKPFSFVAVDEIQMALKTAEVHKLLDTSTKFRSFAAPLIYHSKVMGNFPQFVVAGTGMDFELMHDILESVAMKGNICTEYRIIADFKPLDGTLIRDYARSVLLDHQIEDIDAVVELIGQFDMCHGRPRFVAWILEDYLVSKNIDLTIARFLAAITNVRSSAFPLRFFRDDLEANRISLSRVIGKQTLLDILTDGVLEFITIGAGILKIKYAAAADSVRFGLGYVELQDNVIIGLKILEPAVIECLHRFIPFGEVVKTFALDMLSLIHI
jgi:hypothetical protein